MRYLSVCSGIEAATVAWHPLGWKPAAFSEIEPFPRAVLARHYPDVPCHGDFTTIGADEYGPIDLLVGGTPCQSFSVAGLRGGIHDDRGNLALEFLRLADRTRPRWLVWENVPGVFSAASHDAPDFSPPEIDLDSDDAPQDGEEVVVEDRYDADESHAFACFLAGLSELGYGFAYRVLDAQYAGVPQRRRRVFVVGYLGDWRRAAAVLFERHSLSGDSPPRREKGQNSAGTVTARTCRSVGAQDTANGHLFASTGDVSHCLNAGGMGRQDYETETLIAHSLRGEGFDASEDGTGRGTPLVPTFAIQERAVSENLENGPQGKGYQPDCAYTLEARNKVQAVAFAQNSRDEVRELGGDGQIAGALAAEPGMKQTTYVAFTAKDYGADASDISPTLRSGGHDGSHANGGVMPAVAFNARQDPTVGAVADPLGTKDTGHGIMVSSAVRRLTPRECERLQGFPDDYTLVPYRGKPAADGPRYKALGNSMAVPVMRWIGERIALVDAIGQQRAAA